MTEFEWRHSSSSFRWGPVSSLPKCTGLVLRDHSGERPLGMPRAPKRRSSGNELLAEGGQDGVWFLGIGRCVWEQG